MLADNPMADFKPPVTHTPARRFRILVVDDNHDSALSLAMMLSIMGHDTRTAHDGRVDLVHEGYPETVVLLPRDGAFDPADVAKFDMTSAPRV